MLKSIKEAELYKDLPTKDLKKVIRKYKFLSKWNSDIYNFVFTMVCMVLGLSLFVGITFTSLVTLLVVHYLFFWEYLHKYKKSKVVSDKDRDEIENVISILEGYLKERETKNPSK
jgi:hypothetical protein